MSNQLIFCGSGKNHWFTNESGKKTGQSIRCLVNLDELEQMFDTYGFTGNDGKRMIKVNVMSYKNGPTEKGYTHSLSIDTWKPEQQGQQPQGNNNGAQGQQYQPRSNDFANQHGGQNPNQQQGGNQTPQQQGGGNQQQYTPPTVPGTYEDDIPF